MTKLYEKLVKSCPSESEISKGLKKVRSSIPEVPGKHLLMNILNAIDLTSLNTADYKSNIIRPGIILFHLFIMVNSFKLD